MSIRNGLTATASVVLIAASLLAGAAALAQGDPAATSGGAVGAAATGSEEVGRAATGRGANGAVGAAGAGEAGAADTGAGANGGIATGSLASPTDAAFLAKAVPAGRDEVRAAHRALKKSSSAAVKKAAQMMANDHTMANKKLAALAVQKGWSLPPRDKSAAAPDAYTDAAYVADQIKAHQDAIALFTDEAGNGSDADLKAFAQKTLPKLQHHLKVLQALPS